jgi:hypothetical protein
LSTDRFLVGDGVSGYEKPGFKPHLLKYESMTLPERGVKELVWVPQPDSLVQ